MLYILTDDAKCWFYIFLEKGTFKLNEKGTQNFKGLFFVQFCRSLIEK